MIDFLQPCNLQVPIIYTNRVRKMQNLFQMSHIIYRDICLRLKRPSVEAWPACFHARPLETQPHGLNLKLGLESFLEGHPVFLSGGRLESIQREQLQACLCWPSPSAPLPPAPWTKAAAHWWRRRRWRAGGGALEAAKVAVKRRQ